MTELSSNSRMPEIDALRGIAALSVVLLHYTTDFHNNFHPARFSAISWGYGAYGVHLFFLISGFVILMTAERSRSPRDFILSRFSRLYPPYWVAVIFTTTLLVIFPLQLQTPIPSLLRRGIANLSMIQYWIRVQPVDSVYWTLQVELSFYLIILCLIWRRAIDRAIPVMTAVVVAALVDHLVVSHPLNEPYSYFYGLFFLENAYLFTIGMVLYKCQKQFRWYYVPIIFLCLMCPANANYFPNTPWQDTLVSAALTALLACAAYGHGKWLVRRPLLFLGSISYSLYLIYHSLGFFVLTRLDSIGVEPNVALLAALVIAILVATVMRRWIELPFLHWFRIRFVNRSPKTVNSSLESQIYPGHRN